MLITIIAKTDEMDYIINVISLAVLILFTIVEIVILLKNLKSDLIIKSLIYNTNDTINTGGLIINNIFLLIGLGLGIWSTVVHFVSENVNIVNATTVLIPMCFYTVVNTILYNVYLFIYRFKKFKITDLQ
jgi:hypothetical protein